MRNGIENEFDEVEEDSPAAGLGRWLFKRLSVSLGLKVQKAANLADISVLFSQLFFGVKFVSVLFKSRFASLTDQHVLNCCQLPHHPIPCVENGPAIFDHINLILGFSGIVCFNIVVK